MHDPFEFQSDDAIPALHESVRLGLERSDSYLVALALYYFVSGALDSGLLQVPYTQLSQLLEQAGALAARRPPGTVPPVTAAEYAVLHSLMRAATQLQWPELSSPNAAFTSLSEAASRLALPASVAPTQVVSATLHHQRRALRASVWVRV